MNNLKERTNLLKLIFSIASLISAALFLFISILAMNIVNTIFGHVEIAILLCILGVVIMFILVPILDRNERFKEWFQFGKLNYKWIIILLISSAFTLVLFLIYLIQTDFVNLDLDSSVNLSFLVFFLGSLLLDASGFLFYFGIKNMRSLEIQKIKFSIFGTISILFLLISTIGLILLYNFYIIFPAPTITNGIGHNEGPWLTWHDNKPSESICISWLTAESNTSVISYGIDPNNLDLAATGTGTLLHKVFLSNLSPGTTYYYRIPEDFSDTHSTKIFSFTTATSTEQRFKFAVVGDMQPDNQGMIDRGEIVAEGIANRNYDFVVQLGDVADSGGELEDWHKVLGNVPRFAAYTTFQAVIGNHDWAGGLGSSNWNELFTYNYENPSIGRYYSFDYHNAHFVMIDNFEHYYKMSQEQLNWIAEDITEARQNGQEWIFCAFHLSMLTASTSGMMWDLQESLMPIFDQLDVDAVFFAHDHDYQHYIYTYGKDGLVFDPSHDWTHNEIHYFCSGGGGANLEVGYGVLEQKMERTDSRTWWDQNTNSYSTIEYERTGWDSTKYITHSDFATQYSHWEAEDLGKYYYYLPEESTYNEYAEQVGFDYGEQAYHFIELDINGNTCTISVRYPNGVLLSGPGNIHPQQWTLTK